VTPGRIAGLTLALAVAVAVTVGIVLTHRGKSRTVVPVAPLRPAYNASPSAVSCGKQIISDWWADGHIDRHYGLKCYGAAWGLLPVDGPPTTTIVRQIMRAYNTRATAAAASQGRS
jgi:hypothetical protein